MTLIDNDVSCLLVEYSGILKAGFFLTFTWIQLDKIIRLILKIYKLLYQRFFYGGFYNINIQWLTEIFDDYITLQGGCDFRGTFEAGQNKEQGIREVVLDFSYKLNAIHLRHFHITNNYPDIPSTVHYFYRLNSR